MYIDFCFSCKDEIFFTWNKSDSVALQGFIIDIRETDRTVLLNMSTGSSVEFMNIRIENRDSELFTCVHHEPGVQKYRLPFVVGHTKLAHSDWLRSALIRAACCCTTVDDFQAEKTYIEVTFLANGYSPVFVDKHVQHFFDYFHSSAMRHSLDQTMYNKFRLKWFDYMLLQHEHSDETMKLIEQGQLVHLNYFYEYGPRCQFNERFFQLWSLYFNRHPTLRRDKLKLRIQPKHYQTLNSFLVGRKLGSLIV